MRVLIISDAWHPQVNGVVRTYEHLYAELIRTGHEVEIIGPSHFPLRFPMPGYSEIDLVLVPYRRLSSKIKAFNPDHLHIATEGPLGWAARRYALKHKLDFTTSYHTHFPDYLAKRVGFLGPTLTAWIRKQAINTLRRFHTPAKVMMIATQSLEDELRQWGFHTPATRLTRGVDMTVFKPGEKTLFRDLTAPIALYVGRVAIEKNIEAFLTMSWSGTKVVVGDGPSLHTLQQKYPEVIFTGKKTGEELAAHYRSADLFVFPSKTDTFGIVLLEALASGLPIIAYNVTGPKDIITQTQLGFLGDDLAAMAHQALSTGTAEERRQHVLEHYSWENAARQFLDAAA